MGMINLSQISKVTKNLVNVLFIAYGLSFAYLIVWRLYLVGISNGLNFEAVIDANSKAGYTPLFVQSFLFATSALAVLFMLINTAANVLLEAKIVKFGETIDFDLPLQAKNKIKLKVRDVLFYKALGYISIIVCLFFITFSRVFFELLGIDLSLIPIELLGIVFFLIGFIAVRKGSKENVELFELTSKALEDIFYNIKHKN